MSFLSASWFFGIQAVAMLLIAASMLYASYQTTVLRRASVYISAGFFFAVGMPHTIHLAKALNWIPPTIGVELESVTVMIGTVFFLLAGYESLHNVSPAIQEIHRVMDSISHGDFSAEFDPKLTERDDEIGSLAQSFERLIASLKLAVKDTDPDLANDLEHIENQLETEQENFRKLFMDLPVPYYVIDLDGNYLNVNNAGAEIANCGRKDFIGHHISDFDTPEGVKEGMKAIHKVVETNDVVDTEIEFKTKTGETKNSLIHVAPIHDEHGEITAVQSIVIETKDKEPEKEE